MRRFAWNFSWRKRRLLAQFVGASVTRLDLRRPPAPGDELFVWGMAPLPAGLPRDIRIRRVEDGFLRSVGLGAALAAPASWVIDGEGLHYDPSSPSKLERILNAAPFAQEQIERARHVRSMIVERGLSKYNLRGCPWSRPTGKDRLTILVPGQVMGDASVRCGAIGAVTTNVELLRAVRLEHPQAYLIYKRHPDVHAGLRNGADDNARDWADQVVTDSDIARLLEQVDRVHVLTSLAGFEALLRGVPVTCYGMPFYAGWGLTDDRVKVGRRQRVLSLDELVAGALLVYPTYLHPIRRTPARVEDVIHALSAQMTIPQRITQKLAAVIMRRAPKS